MTVFSAIDWSRAETIGCGLRRWRASADGAHKLATTTVLGGAALVALAWPGVEAAVAPWGGAALLVGGALIGVPHGSSDFVVAHRALRPILGRVWLPAFLVGYLAIVALVLLGWWPAPLATLLAFVLLSGLHFGRGDLDADERGDGLALAVRATTPLLPVLLLHPASVTGLIAMLGGVRASTVAWALDGLRWPLLLPWAMAVACYVVPRVLSAARAPQRARRSRDALQVGAIALAAVTLPALLAFALYFCLVHALRHMIGIVDDRQPHDARGAIVLVAAIVVPSAAVCLVALALVWDGIAGTLGTADVLAWSIRLIAALTVPHMALEAWAERSVH